MILSKKNLFILFVPPGDPNALSNAVKMLSENRARAVAMGRAARELVVATFNRERQEGDFVNLIEMLGRKEKAVQRYETFSVNRSTLTVPETASLKKS